MVRLNNVCSESYRAHDIAIDMSYDSKGYVNDPSAKSNGYPSQTPGGGYHLYRERNARPHRESCAKRDSGNGSMPSSPIHSPGPLFQEDQAQVNNAYQPPLLLGVALEDSEHLKSSIVLDSAVVLPALQAEVSNGTGTDLFFESLSVDTETARGDKALWPRENAFTSEPIPNSNSVTTAHGGEPHPSGATSGAHPKAGNYNQGSSKISLRKHLRDDEDDPDQNEGGDGSPKRPKKISSPPQNEDDSRKFACPYRKRDPRKYCIQHWRPCALTPLETIARVK